MKVIIELGQMRSIEVEHIMEDVYQITQLNGKVVVEGAMGDMVRKTQKGWIVYRSPKMNIPKYRIPSSARYQVPVEVLSNDGEE